MRERRRSSKYFLRRFEKAEKEMFFKGCKLEE